MKRWPLNKPHYVIHALKVLSFTYAKGVVGYFLITLVTVIFYPKYHWLEVSSEMDISLARRANDIFTDD